MISEEPPGTTPRDEPCQVTGEARGLELAARPEGEPVDQHGAAWARGRWRHSRAALCVRKYVSYREPLRAAALLLLLCVCYCYRPAASVVRSVCASANTTYTERLQDRLLEQRPRLGLGQQLNLGSPSGQLRSTPGPHALGLLCTENY